MLKLCYLQGKVAIQCYNRVVKLKFSADEFLLQREQESHAAESVVLCLPGRRGLLRTNQGVPCLALPCPPSEQKHICDNLVLLSKSCLGAASETKCYVS